MTALSMLAIAWGILIAAFLALTIYRAHLTNMETDQLFLSDEQGTGSMHQEQDAIIQRVQALAPAMKVMSIAIALTTVALVTLYLVQVVLPNVHLD